MIYIVSVAFAMKSVETVNIKGERVAIQLKEKGRWGSVNLFFDRLGCAVIISIVTDVYY